MLTCVLWRAYRKVSVRASLPDEGQLACLHFVLLAGGSRMPTARQRVCQVVRSSALPNQTATSAVRAPSYPPLACSSRRLLAAQRRWTMRSWYEVEGGRAALYWNDSKDWKNRSRGVERGVAASGGAVRWLPEAARCCCLAEEVVNVLLLHCKQHSARCSCECSRESMMCCLSCFALANSRAHTPHANMAAGCWHTLRESFRIENMSWGTAGESLKRR